MPATVPSTDIAPGVPALTRARVVTRNVDWPHALPISLATVSLPPAVSAATIAMLHCDTSAVVTAAAAAMVATPQLPIALPAPLRPLFSSAMPSSALRCNPRRDAAVAKGEGAESTDQARGPP